jgi:hypothetical protein
MKGERGRLYAIGSIVFFLIITTVLVLELVQIRRSNEITTERSFTALASVIEARWEELGLPEAGQGMNEAFPPGPSPLVVSVYSFDLGLDYLWARDDTFLGDSADPEVSTTPPIRMNSIVHQRYSRSFTLSDGSRRMVTAVFPVLDAPSVFPLFRNILIAILAFLIVLLAVAISGLLRTKDTPAAPPPKAETASDGALLAPEEALGRRLTLELERSAFQEQDLSVAIFRFHGPHNETAREMNAKAVLSFFTFEDLCFRHGNDEIVVVFPATTLSDTLGQLERFQRYYWEERHNWNAPNADFCCGVSARNGRLVSGDRVLSECRAAVKRAEKTAGRIVGFHPDPQRYRAYLMTQSR